MSFLNISLLFGALAIAAPIIIHLLSRTRFRTIDWGAMHLLESLEDTTQRRFQWESLLLLLVRCSIPVLLALTLARPVLTMWNLRGSAQDRTSFILLDDSFSLSSVASDGDGRSHWQRLQVEIAKLLKSRTSSTAPTLIWKTGGRSLTPLGDDDTSLVELIDEFQGTQPTATECDFASALMSAIKHLRSLPIKDAELIIASDFQASEWQEMRKEQLEAIRAELTADPAKPILLTLFQATSNLEVESSNLAVRLPEGGIPQVHLGQSTTVQTEIINYSAKDHTCNVVLEFDGQPLTQQSLTVPAGQSTIMPFQFAVDEPGWHELAVRIDPQDSVQEDNTAWQMLEITELKRLMILDSTPVVSQFGDSDYFQAAIAPFGGESFVRNRWQVTQPRELASQIAELQRSDVVVLFFDPLHRAELDNALTRQLSRFVADGGGMVLIPKDVANLESIQTGLSAVDQPAWFKEFCPFSLLGVQPADPNMRERMSSTPILVPELEIFNGTSGGDLRDVEFMHWLAVQDPPLSLESDAAMDTTEIRTSTDKVLLQLSSGTPLVASRNIGAGVIVLLAVSAGPNWSSLPMDAAYVTLMQRLAQLATPKNRWQTAVRGGDRIRIGVSEIGQQGTPANYAENLEWVIEDEAGKNVSRTSVRPGEIEVLSLAPLVPGMYRVSLDTSRIDPEIVSPEALRPVPPAFITQAAQRESKLRLLSEAELKSTAESLGAQIVTSAEGYQALEDLRTKGREIWRYALGLLLAMVLIEVWFQQFLSRGTL
ncbi:MAG: BatA domain-containing protein [Planctomycetales bacterium]|nr:BatA domain-containing protein [Planctomycetales bacterium]